MSHKLLREIARPFKRLSRRRIDVVPAAPKAEPTVAEKMPGVEYLAPTRALHELLPVVDQVELRLFARLIRTHVWAMPEQELMVLAAVVGALRPRRLFEFGTYTGGSTLTIAANAHEDFSLTTLDIGPIEQYGVQYEPGALYRNTRFAPRIEQLVADSLQFDVGARRGVMDFIFVDANHRYDWARNDTRLAFEMLRPGGVVLWHDYTWLPQHAECIGVTHTVNEVQRARGNCWHIDGTRFAIYLP